MITKIEKAFLDTIAFSEGMLGVSFNGYDVLGGYYKINGWSSDTNIKHGGDSWRQKQTPGKTVDVGRYQFNIGSWQGINNGVNLPLTSKNQDNSALKLWNERVKLVNSNFNNESITDKSKFSELVNILKKNTWYGLRINSIEDLFRIFNLALSKY